MEVNGKTAEPVLDLLADKPVKVKKAKKSKNEKPEKGVETLFRVASTNSQQLSNQADAKANLLITVNSIIVSILLSTVVKNLESNKHLTIPSLMLLAVSLITIVFSILATRPHVPAGTFTQKEVNEKKANLLFFGNFYRMPFNKYSRGMLQMMDDRDFLYMGLIKDVYNQGTVLGKKYRLLKIAYDVFMFGLVISVIAFFVASRFHANPS